jgi:MFS family permease
VFTQYFQLVRGYSPLAAGLWALPAGLAQFAVANAARPLVARHGFRHVLCAGLLASTLGLLVLATSGTRSSPWVFEAGLALLGAGIGLTMPPATGAIMSSLPPHRAGVGSALNDLNRELGGAFGIGVLGSLTATHFQSRLTPALASFTATHFPSRPTPALASHPGPVTAAAAEANRGLAQALALAGGPHAPLAVAARAAYTSGLDLAMLIGAAVVLAAAIVVYLALPAKPSPPDASQVPLTPPARTGNIAR